MKKVIIISDIHLGTPFSKKDIFLNFINNLETDLLVLNGDIYDLYEAISLDIDIFSLIKKNINIKKYIYIKGNHDYSMEEIFKEEIFVTQTNLPDNIVVTHGHTFDFLSPTNPLNGGGLSFLKSWFYNIFHINIKVCLLNMWIVGKLIKSILFQAQKKAVKAYPDKRVILGHTHLPQVEHPYYNSGGMLDSICTYIEIIYDENNKASITLKDGLTHEKL